MALRRNLILWRTEDNLFYFEDNPTDLFDIVTFQWDGPKYDERQITKTKGKKKGKTKRTGRLAGAALGTIVAPGVGTVGGALLGTGNKVIDVDMESTSVTKTLRIEVDSRARLVLERFGSEEQVTLDICCRSNIGLKLREFAQAAEAERLALEPPAQQSIQSNGCNPYDDLAKAKKLLDMGAITEEDYLWKKRQLFGR